jgi:hypothetical protein
LEMEVSQAICPGWPLTLILLISASQLARITCVRHSTQLVLIGFDSLALIHVVISDGRFVG